MSKKKNCNPLESIETHRKYHVDNPLRNNPTEKRDSVIQKKKIMLHKTKEYATDVIPTPPVESWEKSFDEKFIMPEEHLGKDYWQGGYTPRVWGKYQDMVEIKKFISSQIQQAEERLVERIEPMKYKVEYPNMQMSEVEKGIYLKAYYQAINDILATLKEEKDL